MTIGTESIMAQFTNGVQTITERFIQMAEYDKTISAIIVSADPYIPNDYYVSTTGYANLKVHTLENDKTEYNKGDNVYISIPGGNFNSSDKIIIGKRQYIEDIYYFQNLDDILIIKDSDLLERDNSKSYFENNEKFTTLVIEFTPKVELYYKNKKWSKYTQEEKQKILEILPRRLILEEKDFLFQIKDENKSYTNNSWSTRHLYGNVFEDGIFIPHPQRLVLYGFENYKEITVEWDKQSSLAKIPILSFYGEKIEDFYANIELKDKKYYYGFLQEDLNERVINDVSFRVTRDGYLLFMKKGFFDITLEEEIANQWERKNISLESLPRHYNWRVELHKENYIKKTEINSLMTNNNGSLSLEELGLNNETEEETVFAFKEYIPIQYQSYVFTKFNTTKANINKSLELYKGNFNQTLDTFKSNGLICLISWPVGEEENKHNRKVVYDIIERKEQ